MTDKKTDTQRIKELENTLDSNLVTMTSLMNKYKKIEEENKKIRVELKNLKQENDTALTSVEGKAKEFTEMMLDFEKLLDETTEALFEVPAK